MPFTLSTPNGPLHVSMAAGALTLSFNGMENYSFDGEGRPIGMWRRAITYRRALDNRILAKWIDPHRPGRRLRRLLSDDERYTLLTDVLARASAAQAFLRDAGESEAAAARLWLERVAQWNWQRLEGEAARFGAVYKPVPILPPDQYLSLVIQATEGCSYNDCTFCTFYRDRPFRIKGLDALEAHIEGVRAFVGRGLTLRRSIFLADANAVIIAQDKLLPMLDLVNARLPVGPGALDAIYAFISAPDALRKSAADFGEIKARNVQRLYVGLESGHNPLRRFLRKQGDAADVVAAVQSIKGGGLAVGLIAMVGVGGMRFKEAHLRDTVALIEQMALGAGDIIYLSPFVSDGATQYDADVEAAAIAPLDEEAIRAEEARFKAALQPLAKRTGLRISHYDVREFVY
jgi:hypothetical protein